MADAQFRFGRKAGFFVVTNNNGLTESLEQVVGQADALAMTQHLFIPQLFYIDIGLADFLRGEKRL